MYRHNHIVSFDGHPIVCIGDESRPHGPGNFHICWQVATSRPHADMFGINSPITTGPCIHLGESTGKTVFCKSCGGGWHIKTFGCAIHGICTAHKRVNGVKGCCTDEYGQICPEYEARKQFKLIVDQLGIGDHIMALTVLAAWKQRNPKSIVTLAGPFVDGMTDWINLFEEGIISKRAQNLGTAIYPETEESQRSCNYVGAIAQIPKTERALLHLRPLPEASVQWAEQYRGHVVLAPFSDYPDREWPMEQWLELEQQLPCVVIGRGHHAEAMKAFKCDTFAGRSPSDIAALCQVCRCVIGNDSGIAHLAGSLGIRCVCVVGGDWGELVHGFYPNTVIVRGEGMASVSVQRVLDVLTAVCDKPTVTA